MAKKKVQTSVTEIIVPIKWHVPDTIITRFASNMTIQPLEYEFKVSFFETKPEIRTDSNAPLPTEVRADCVASVIINIAKMPGFIAALQKQMDAYTAKHPTEPQTK
ncbi:MAG: hypothetical protein WA126_04660 [Thermodesulfovibrionales bacterium]